MKPSCEKHCFVHKCILYYYQELYKLKPKTKHTRHDFLPYSKELSQMSFRL